MGRSSVPYRDFAYPLNVFMHVLTREGGRVDALHYGLFESADESLGAAQERSTTLLLARLSAPPVRVLDVGIGVGTLLQRLTSAGYDAAGITPDAQQLAMVRERFGDRITASGGRFEDFEAPPTQAVGSADGLPFGQGLPFDVVIFQESSQYIDSEALFRKAAALAPRVLVLDEFALQPVDTGEGLRSRGRFLSAAQAAGFQVVEEIDLSSQAAPTVDYFLTRIPRHRQALTSDLGLSSGQIDDLLRSGEQYRERYQRGEYGYRLFDLRRPAPAVIVDPFLHVREDAIEHPITGRTLNREDAGHAALLQLLEPGAERGPEPGRIAPEVRQQLQEEGWLVAAGPDLARRFRLRVVTIETHTACNQACYFCPVSIAPRDAGRMPDALFDAIVRQLVSFRHTLEGVFFSGYNEPTLDPRFVDRCARLMAAGLPVAVNTNATGLTPARVDQLEAAGRLRLLSVNLSTLDRDRYADDRGCDHLALVLRNLDGMKNRPIAAEMVIAVLGSGDATHQADFESLRTRFAGSRFEVRFHEVMDRAGRLPIGLAPAASTTSTLHGCDNLGSRPLHHLHIAADGRCVFCCEDYDERYVVGDLHTMTIDDLLRGDALATLRRWSYGLEAAPDDFICHKCIFALRR